MISVKLNGEKKILPLNTSLQAVLAEIGERLKPFAVALNGRFVSQTGYGNVLLQEGDEIAIITPMQGG